MRKKGIAVRGHPPVARAGSPHRDKLGGSPFRTSVIYVVLAGLWTLFSDPMLAAFGVNRPAIPGLTTGLGLAFVAITAVLFYAAMRRQLRLQAREISGRKEAEGSLEKTNRALHMISNCNQILIRATDESELLKNICRLVVEEGGYKLAWVGYPVDRDACSVRSVAQAGWENGVAAETRQLTLADLPRNRGPVGTTIRTGRMNIFRSVDEDPEFAPWREATHPGDYEIAISLPLTAGGKTFGALSIYSGGTDAFELMEAGLLAELADDLAFGIAGLRAQAARRRIEQELRGSEERLRLAQAAAKIGIFDVDLVCDFATWTVEEEALFGFAPGGYDHTSKTFWELLHPEDRERIRVMSDAAIAGRTEFNAEYRFRRASDQALRWALVRGKAVYDKKGRPVRLLGVNIDITEAKNAEAALQVSRALYHSLVEQMPAGVFRKNAEGRYVFVNTLFCRLQKMEAVDFLDKLPREVAAGERARQDPDGLASKFAARSEENHTSIMQNRLALREEREYIGNDGLKQVLHVVIIPVLGADGKIIGTQGMMFDVTQGKETEEAHLRLATAVEQAAEDIVITDATGKILYVNPAFERTTGYSSAEVLHKNPRLLKSGKHDAGFYKDMWQKLRHGEVWSGNLVNKKKDGTLFEEEVTISPIRNTAGKIINFVAVRRDVTREVALEGQLRRAQKMEAIGTLAGGIAHDFNNVLAAIMGSAELIRMDVPPDHPASEFLEQIFVAGNRAREVVQQILTFSQRRESERNVIHLQPVIKECVKLLRSTIPAMVEISCHMDPGCSPVLADPTQIHQVIMNLCTNAWQALPENNGRIEVSLGMCPAEEAVAVSPLGSTGGKVVRLSISDNGSGMNKATLERIFEPFFTTKALGEGSGLGLAVVHGIVKTHQGVITVDSELGRGSVFHIYLPPQSTEESAPAVESTALCLGNQERILLVDDDELAGRAMEQILKRIGYRVHWFRHPQEALDHFQLLPMDYDLVISDLAMPGMNGENLAAALLRISPDLPILITTGMIDPAILKKAREIGVGNVLLKPVDTVSLAREIAQRLRVRRAGSPGSPW